MAGRNAVVFGIYDTKDSVEDAVMALQVAGFRSADVSALLPGPMGTKGLVAEKATKAPEGAVTGGTSGAVIGGTLGWLAGIGAFAIPGVGPLIAAGPIAAALAGVGVGSTVGGFTGALVGLGIPEYEAKRYEGRVAKGGSLLSVCCDSAYWVKLAREIMKDTGAEDISVMTEVEEHETYPLSSQPKAPTGSELFVEDRDQREEEYRFSMRYSGAGSDVASTELPSKEEIERRAYELYLARGGAHGHDIEDWLEAERELKEQYRSRNLPRAAKATAGG